ncbi:MAG: amidohydrolase family protein [Spirochaetia bacterium]|nr:amidohydrolase family protein [Spirochaetia bacterium]
MSREWQITNGTIVLADGPRKLAGLLVSNGEIEEVLGPGDERSDLITLNLHGLTVLPGFINGHDTLIASFPGVRGENWPHLNWLSFDNDLKRSEVFRERMLIEPTSLYEVGALKNLYSGATSVVDHIPAFVRSPFVDDLPVSLLPDFGISHSICSYSLGWGEGMKAEHARANNQDLPYITHIAEGFDPESVLSLQVLDKAGCLSDHTVLVHGLSLSPEDLDKIADAGAHFVWCPSANLAVYNRTVIISDFLARGINVSLGTDAAVTGSRHMLDEVKTAAKVYKEQTGNDVDSATLLSMITTNPARAFRWPSKGNLKPGSDADFIVLDRADPAEWMQCSPVDIYLIVKSGVPVFGSADLEALFVSSGIHFEKLQIGNAQKIVQKGVKKLRETIQRATGRTNLDFVPGW